MLLERMRGGTPPKDRQKPRREDKEAAAPWPRLKPKAPGTPRPPGTVRAGLRTHGPIKRRRKRGDRGKVANEMLEERPDLHLGGGSQQAPLGLGVWPIIGWPEDVVENTRGVV